MTATWRHSGRTDKSLSFQGVAGFREEEKAWSGSVHEVHKGQLPLLGPGIGDKNSHYLRGF